MSAGRVKRKAGTIVFCGSEFRSACDRVDAPGIVGEIEQLLPSGGRPRYLTVRTLLVALTLIADSGQPMHLNLVPDLLNSLEPSHRFDLGLAEPVTHRMVYRLFNHVGNLTDPSTCWQPARADTERESATDLLERFVAGVLDASLPADDEYSCPGDLAIDATFVDANSRPEATKVRAKIKAAQARAQAANQPTDLASMVANDASLRKKLRITDPEADPLAFESDLARVAARDRPPADPDAATIVDKDNKIRHAYAFHMTIDIPTVADVAATQKWKRGRFQAERDGTLNTCTRPAPTPMLIRGLNVTASTAPAGPSGLKLLIDLAEREPRNNYKPGPITADRAYPYSILENWHNPARAMGHTLVHDLHPNQRGLNGTFAGVVIIDGEPFSPGIMDYPDLVDLGTIPAFSKPAEREEFIRRAEQRQAFALPVHSRSADGTKVRFTCPALRGKLTCPTRHKPGTVIGDYEVFTPPNPAPPICSKASVEIPAELLAWANDGVAYGTRAWFDAYFRRRARIEGGNGILKNPVAPHFAPGRIRVRGTARTTIMAVLVVAAYNQGAINAWRNKCAEIETANAAAIRARRSRTKPTAKAPKAADTRRRRKARAPT